MSLLTKRDYPLRKRNIISSVSKLKKEAATREEPVVVTKEVPVNTSLLPLEGLDNSVELKKITKIVQVSDASPKVGNVPKRPETKRLVCEYLYL